MPEVPEGIKPVPARGPGWASRGLSDGGPGAVSWSAPEIRTVPRAPASDVPDAEGHLERDERDS